MRLAGALMVIHTWEIKHGISVTSVSIKPHVIESQQITVSRYERMHA
jgi:hypothetical protein